MDTKNTGKYRLGMVGLGTMGRNLLLNMADKGFNVTGYDRDPKMTAKLQEEGKDHDLKAFNNINDFVDSLASPKTIVLLVPAGKIVDDVINELEPLLGEGDIIIDSGNSYFLDTTRRVEQLAKKGIHFFGMGISGGEEGARFGPSMMPGGDKEAYASVADILEAVAAKVDGDACVTYIGPGASGHFVKMTHNGIEYAIMQAIGEIYDVMRKALAYDNAKMHEIFKKWNDGKLKSFLVEITQEILAYKDVETGKLMVDIVKDEARAKGTGKWTCEIGMELQAPLPSINDAVSARDLSKYKTLRVQLAELYNDMAPAGTAVSDDAMEDALYAAMIVAYAQGMQLLTLASAEYDYQLNLAEIAKIWRGGCIIRSAFLNDIYAAYTKDNNLQHLFLDGEVARLLKASTPGLKTIIKACLDNNIAVPVLSATAAYFDGYKTAESPLNLIQAQRDFFGAHTFERKDKDGVFHAEWNNV